MPVPCAPPSLHLLAPAGKDEADQIDKILQVVGQPTEATMPGCTSYPNYAVIAVQRYPARSRLRQASPPALPCPPAAPRPHQSVVLLSCVVWAKKDGRT